MSNTRVILLFGTFNPFTMAHFHMALYLRSQFSDTDVIFVPSTDKFIMNWKKYSASDIWSGDVRVALIEGAIANIPDIFVSRIEIDRIVDGKTYNSVEYFKNIYDEVYICMGMDKLDELGKWYKADKLVSENKFIMFTRNKEEFHVNDFIKPYVNNFVTYTDKMGIYDGVSSTQVRKAYEEDRLEEVRNILPVNVYEYLKESKCQCEIMS